MKNSFKYTFIRLITEYRVEIPVIQRDYAQGRIEVKTDQIRKGFVDALLGALKNNSPLHLDFIYGKIKGDLNSELLWRNQKSIGELLKAVKTYADNLDVKINYDLPPEEDSQKALKQYFIPLDGQQRLTTLFLVHWYLCYRNGQPEKRLYNFSYKTRKSSRDFCKALVEHVNQLKGDASSISELLKDQKFLFDEWLRDPTVSGMMVMLDEIQNSLKDASEDDIKVYYDRLYSPVEEMITFDFLDLDKIEEEDELYVKMNSRGKQLTDFENFKSWLIAYVEDKGLELMSEWDVRIDKEWMDIFWRHRDSVDDVDSAYLNLFRRFGQYYYVSQAQLQGQADLSKEIRDILEQLDIERNGADNFLPMTFYEKHTIFNEGSLSDLFVFLSFLEKGGSIRLDELIKAYSGKPFFEYSFSKSLFTGTVGLNLFHKTFLYAIIRFVVKLNKPVNLYDTEDEALFSQWVRISQNLIYNSRIDDFPEYVSAITSIYLLSDHCLNIINYLTGNPRILYFPAIQRTEEILKASLIKEDPNWTQDLLQYERHAYFYGQIGFLLALADNQSVHDRVLFNHYAENAAIYFSKEYLDNSDHLLERALLCKGDYLIDKDSYRWSFCRSKQGNARERDENWRRVFNDDSAGGGQSLLRLILDDPRSLQEIIDQEAGRLEDWRKYFVSYPKCIDVCDQRMIRMDEREDGKYWIRLLGQSQLNHYHNELYTYLLYLRLRPFVHEGGVFALKYHPVKRSEDSSYLEIIMEDKRIEVVFNGPEFLFEIYLYGNKMEMEAQLLTMDYQVRDENLIKAVDIDVLYKDLHGILMPLS
ncbi:Protein of unknown function DUF262 [Chitinophaga sp. CF118]|uniref:DUF262 domain-containing protein n=1 Tax=Chitinophaga sp. CF118 TaxID=1884367 RepID=UPI0008ECF1D7|nr:DUF262 domain-containing protein [Chitinophaga sp. CF118]SFE49582.1 Protein of unknown function DUF262 [Chitinophaga sp. CF118]